MHPQQLDQLATHQRREAVQRAAQGRRARAGRRAARRPETGDDAPRGGDDGAASRSPGRARAAAHRPHAGFRRLWASAAASNLADGILFAGLPVLATQVTDSPALIAGVAVALMLPMALAALPAGVVADRFDRRAVLLTGNLVRALGIVVVLAAVAAGELGLAAIYAVAAIAGGSEILVDTTAQTTVPSLVERDGLERANARLGGTQVVLNNAIGAPIGSFLAGVGVGLVFGVPVLLFALAAVLVRRLPSMARPRRPREAPLLAGLRTDVAEGMRHLVEHPVLRRIALASAASNLGNTAFFAVLVVLVVGPLDLPSAAYGWFLAAVAAGGVLGSLVAGRLLRGLGHVRTIQVVAVAVVGGYVVAALTSSPLVLALAVASLGSASMIWNTGTRVLRQTLVPDALLGRVTSSMALVAIVSTPVGGIVGGLVAEVAGVRAAGGVAVAANLLALLLVLRLTIGRAARARVRGDGPAVAQAVASDQRARQLVSSEASSGSPRSSRRCTLPVAVNGSASTTSTRDGHL